MKKVSPRVIWLFLISYLLRLGIVPVGFGLYLISLVPEDQPVSEAFYGSLATSINATIILWFLFSLVWSLLAYNSYRYELSKEGLEKRLGVITKRAMTIPYENIQNIEIDRNLLARIFGLSELRIETAGVHPESEGRLAGLRRLEAETLKNELIKRSREVKAGFA